MSHGVSRADPQPGGVLTQEAARQNAPARECNYGEKLRPVEKVGAELGQRVHEWGDGISRRDWARVARPAWAPWPGARRGRRSRGSRRRCDASRTGGGGRRRRGGGRRGGGGGR